MEIKKVESGKEQYVKILSIAEPSRELMDIYLNECDLFVLFDEGNEPIGAAAVIVSEDGAECELKNISIISKKQGKGYGRLVLEYLFTYYKKAGYSAIFAGAAKLNTSCMEFYTHCGFYYSYTVEGFYVEDYPRPILEDRARAEDVLYFKKDL